MNENNKVTIVDVKMPLGSMVVFMVKWAIASIPAMIILMIIGTILSSIFIAFMAGMSAGRF